MNFESLQMLILTHHSSNTRLYFPLTGFQLWSYLFPPLDLSGFVEYSTSSNYPVLTFIFDFRCNCTLFYLNDYNSGLRLYSRYLAQIQPCDHTYSCHKYPLITYYLPGIIPGPRGIAMLIVHNWSVSGQHLRWTLFSYPLV